ncbi:endonuclease/exonuclease/phosphatase family protein [Halomonas sp. AOP42-D1-22]|uniref:endonuclease/exonuclease/phosphatase family protein n=1 Tax=Halomonas sp. AOP42-D1-22 TaxID=3457667 RepID=UPI0040343393
MAIPVAAFATVSVASFNIQNLGWQNSKDYKTVALITSSFDVVAVQEVMNEEGAERLHRALEKVSGEAWSYMMSHLIGRGSYKEAYAIYSRDSAARYLDGAVVYLDPEDTFARYQSVRTGDVFALANLHVLYGNRVSDRLPEIDYLASYWEWLKEIYPDTPIILAGDFNLDVGHEGFTALLDQSARLAIEDQGSTTISPINGRYANNYDHIFVSPSVNVTSNGVLRFPQWLGMTHEEARETVSDHVPVWIGLNGGDIKLPETELYEVERPVAMGAEGCIDINQSSQEELVQLPHVGEARAVNIVEGRPWSSADSLSDISGLSPARVTEIINTNQLCP